MLAEAVQADLFGATGRTDAPEVLTALEVDYTPPAVAVQLLLALRRTLAEMGVIWTPHFALDPAAGSGCWGRAMRAVWPDLHLMGVEPRESEAANLRAAYDAAMVGRADDIAGKMFDFIASNPPFSAFGAPSLCEDADEVDGREDQRAPFWPTSFARRHLLTSGGIVLMYGLSQWGQSADAAEHMRDWPPFLQLRCGGRPQHRGVGTKRWAPIPKSRRVPGGPTHEWRKNGGDSREYSGWVWRRADFDRIQALLKTGKPTPRPSWQTVQLPVLPAELRQWHPTAIPGSYPIDPALVAEISERYL
jgi:hypothetical protein